MAADSEDAAAACEDVCHSSPARDAQVSRRGGNPLEEYISSGAPPRRENVDSRDGSSLLDRRASFARQSRLRVQTDSSSFLAAEVAMPPVPAGSTMVDTGAESAGESEPCLQTVRQHRKERLTVLRVKRKVNAEPVDSLWLELCHRPCKRIELERFMASLEELRVSDSGGERGGAPNGGGVGAADGGGGVGAAGGARVGGAPAEEDGDSGPSRRLFRRVETIPASRFRVGRGGGEAFLRHLQEKRKQDTRSPLRRSPGGKNRQLSGGARGVHLVASRQARFAQVWRSRGSKSRVRGRSGSPGAEEEAEAVSELMQLYDVVRVDNEDEASQKAERRREEAKREMQLAEESRQIVCNYLPLLREFVPEVAKKVEVEMAPVAAALKGEAGYVSPLAAQPDKLEDEYVYDVYCLEERSGEAADEDEFPTVRVVQEDNSGEELVADAGECSSYDEEDSNEENNPRNDYPDEEDEETPEEDEEDEDADDEGDEDGSTGSGARVLRGRGGGGGGGVAGGGGRGGKGQPRRSSGGAGDLMWGSDDSQRSGWASEGYNSVAYEPDLDSDDGDDRRLPVVGWPK